MKLYLAGADANPKYNALLERAGAKCKLESYWSLGGKDPSPGYEFYLLDSGGFAARTRNVTIPVIEYAAYINKHGIKYAFNLDTNDVEETLNNQEYLIKNTNAYILPVYHASDWMANNHLLDKFISEGYPYIALGGMAMAGHGKDIEAQFLAHCFRRTTDKVRLHGLGKTSVKDLEKYPFYSVDSTSWLGAARYGNSISKDKAMVKMKSRKRHYLENTYEEVLRWLEVEREINKLWKLRGVSWSDEF